MLGHAYIVANGTNSVASKVYLGMHRTIYMYDIMQYGQHKNYI